jgi:hypothetical protein
MQRRIALQKHFVQNVYAAYVFHEAFGVRTRLRVAF